MKYLVRALTLPAMLLSTAFASGLTGTWTASFNPDTPDVPKPFSRITFDFDEHGSRLDGMAYMAGAGVRPLTGKVDGDRFAFTVEPWRFEGTLDDKQLHLTMFEPAARPMRGEKVESKGTAPVSLHASA